MKKPDTILDAIHATRQKIDEQIQGMTASERTAYFNRTGEAIACKYGLKRVTSVEDGTMQIYQRNDQAVVVDPA